MDRGDGDQTRACNCSTPETKAEPGEPSSLLKGLKSYQIKPSDMEFIKEMEEERLVEKLELPSCEDISQWVKEVLKVTSPSTSLTELDVKFLLAMVTETKIQAVLNEKKAKLVQMRKTLANKRKKDAQERLQLERQIAREQMELQDLTRQLWELKAALVHKKEAFKTLNTREAPETKAEREDASGELQDTKSQVKPQRKFKKVTFADELHDTATQSKVTDNQSIVKDDCAHKNTSETAKTKKQASSVKTAKGPQKKVEVKESSPPESAQAVRGRRKPPVAAQISASQPQSRMKTRGAGSTTEQEAPPCRRQEAAEQEPQNAGLRRSKRIASRRVKTEG